MKYQIDQSGKVEKTSKITIVAFSNGERGSVSLSSKDKKILQNIFRKAGKVKMFSVQTFSVLVFILIKNFKLENKNIIIDREYPGHENLIRSFVVQLSLKQLKVKIDPSLISFQVIGKSSKAHGIANKSFKSKKADFKVTFEEILALILIATKKSGVS